MIHPHDLIVGLGKQGINLFTGVPDSLLADLCDCLYDNENDFSNLIAANEGNAVAIAAGYHMATGNYAAVYMQNSGLGNSINPLTSIADKEVYSIPMLLIIGWRGEPGVKDEPQHVKQGRITEAQLKLLEIPYLIVSSTTNVHDVTNWARKQLDTTNAPVALLVKKNTFLPYKSICKPKQLWQLKREEALEILLPLIDNALVVSTTGKTSREIYELREKHNQPQRDFLTVGGMGHTLSIALGVALGRADKKVVCIDGDGSLLMHLGALPVTGTIGPTNLIHILLNNAAHESVGGQPTVGNSIDFEAIVMASGYKAYALAETANQLKANWEKIIKGPGPAMLEIHIAQGSRDTLGRPKSSPIENKNKFMEWFEQ